MERRKADEVNADAPRLNIPKKRIEDYTKADWTRLEKELKKWEEQRTQRLMATWREARRSKQKLEFENRVGVDLYNLSALYNLDASVADKLLEGRLPENEQEKGQLAVLTYFFQQQSVGPDLIDSLNITIPDKMTEEKEAQLVAQLTEKVDSIFESEFWTFLKILPKESAEYRRLVDKAINSEQPTEDETRFIQSRLRRNILIIWINHDDGGGSLREVASIGVDGIFGHAYSFLRRLWSGEVKVGRCAAEDCNNIFIPYKSGQGQRFCSARCRSRVHKRQKASVDA